MVPFVDGSLRLENEHTKFQNPCLIELEAKQNAAKNLIKNVLALVAGNSLDDLKINFGPKRQTKTALNWGISDDL